MMRKIWIFSLILLIGLMFGKSAYSIENFSSDSIQKTTNTSVQIFHNDQNEVLAEFNIAPNWHISWSNPGDVGQPTTVKATNSSLEITAQSAPQARTLFEFMHEYIYEDYAYFALKLDNLSAAELEFEFVECSDVCKPQKINFDLKNIPPTPNAEWQALHAKAESTFPQKITLTSPKNNNLLTLNRRFDGEIYFTPTQKDIIDESTIEINTTGNKTEIRWQSDTPQKLQQALLLTENQAYLITVDYKSGLSNTLFYMILLAFIGGIILNAMPCVFPILSLKIFNLIKQPPQKIKRLKNALFYTAGILLSFMLLTAMLIWIKQNYENAGWGFQLQSPWFVGFMAVLFLILFLCMIELLHFPNLASQRIFKLADMSEFATGFFAVLIASPCTGPFMGAAIGYAFTRSNPEIFAIFTALALGYALPYAFIELYPQILRRIMPQPGKWMRKLQIILAIPLLLTSLWLFSVLYTQLKDANTAASSSLNWQPYDAQKIAELNQTGANIFVDFTADWCLTCRFNHKIILDTKRFAEFVQKNNVHLFVADLTEHNPQLSAALQAYGRDSIPLYVYYHNGEYRLLPLFFRISSLED